MADNTVIVFKSALICKVTKHHLDFRLVYLMM